MPVNPDSRHAGLPLINAAAPDGTLRRVVAMRLSVPPVAGRADRHLVVQGEGIDLLARRLYGDERLWWRILDANPLRFPLDIGPGEILLVPLPGPATQVTRARTF